MTVLCTCIELLDLPFKMSDSITYKGVDQSGSDDERNTSNGKDGDVIQWGAASYMNMEIAILKTWCVQLIQLVVTKVQDIEHLCMT